MRSLKLSTGAVILLAACAMFAVAQLDAHARINNDSRVKTVSKKDPAPPPTLKISLNPVVGPPTTAVAISGTKFGRTEAVDVYFDSTDLLLAVTNSSGSFSQSLDVPTSAQPGTHWVTAIGRVSGLAAQASFLVQTNWSMFHYNLQHSGYNPFENTLNPGNVAGLNQAWAAPTGSVIYSSPAVANGVVYVGSADDKLYAFNAVTGAVLSGWPVSTLELISSSPAVANGVVYVGTLNPTLYAFNAVTGARLSGWPVSTGASINSSPAVANGVVYVGSEDNNLYAFNAVTGARLSGWPVSTGASINSSPAVVNGTVYVGSNDDNLYAYNLEASLTPEVLSMAAAREATAKAPEPSSLIPDYSLQPRN